jgi:hypothetical protein
MRQATPLFADLERVLTADNIISLDVLASRVLSNTSGG